MMGNKNRGDRPKPCIIPLFADERGGSETPHGVRISLPITLGHHLCCLTLLYCVPPVMFITPT